MKEVEVKEEEAEEEEEDEDEEELSDIISDLEITGAGLGHQERATDSEFRV